MLVPSGGLPHCIGCILGTPSFTQKEKYLASKYWCSSDVLVLIKPLTEIFMHICQSPPLFHTLHGRGPTAAKMYTSYR